MRRLAAFFLNIRDPSGLLQNNTHLFNDQFFRCKLSFLFFSFFPLVCIRPSGNMKIKSSDPIANRSEWSFSNIGLKKDLEKGKAKEKERNGISDMLSRL